MSKIKHRKLYICRQTMSCVNNLKNKLTKKLIKDRIVMKGRIRNKI